MTSKLLIALLVNSLPETSSLNSADAMAADFVSDIMSSRSFTSFAASDLAHLLGGSFNDAVTIFDCLSPNLVVGKIMRPSHLNMKPPKKRC